MIQYWKGLFGIKLLFRVHGSSVYKGMVHGLISAAVYVGITYAFVTRGTEDAHLDHPYSIGVLVGSASFLIIFRANQGYARYWEACGAVHHMMSKWLDATTHAGCYHLQQKHFNSIKPPSYFDHYDLNFLGLSRDRDRGRSSLVSIRDNDEFLPNESKCTWESSRDAKERSINKIRDSKKGKNMNATPASAVPQEPGRGNLPSSPTSINGQNLNAHPSLLGAPRLDGGWDLANAGKPVPANGFTPPLFLQELCHLSSLAVAVAFSTLRNDIEGAESPLDVYIPGSQWPAVDPDKLPRDVKNQFLPRWMVVKNLKYWFGADRTAKVRTRHNASRPMLVLGGVSDAEIEMLQRARGPSAKTQLAWNWLSEFLIREHLAGSMGAVGPPIVSRCFQFLSDGMIYYNHARKIMFIPFPFPSAQISAFFVFLIVWAVPLMLTQYVNFPALGALLSFFTVTCLSGLHEVGKELENPFRNIPNEVPLGTLLAQYNESLVTMYYGYHPDSFWDPSLFESDASSASMEQSKKSSSNGPVLASNGKKFQELENTVARQAAEIQQLRELITKNSRHKLIT